MSFAGSSDAVLKFKGTIWFLAVFLAIGLYYFFVDVPGEKKKTEEKELSEKILAFETGDVEEFALVSKGQTFVLKRKDTGNWELTQPLQTQADSATADELLNTLHKTRFSRTVEDNPKDLAVYGLQEPSLQINLKLKGKGEKSIRIGDNSPIGASFYLQKGGETKVLLSSVSRKDFEKTLYDLRDKALLAFDSATLASVEVKQGDRSFRLAKENQTWTVRGDNVEGKADSIAVDAFLTSLKQVGVKAFIEEDPKNLAPFGLDHPTAVMSLLGEDKSEKSLLIGIQKSMQEYYAKTGQAKNVVTADQKLLQKLSRDALDFLDKTLLELKPDDEVGEISLHTKNEDILLVRDKEGDKAWKVAQPVQIPADQTTVSNLLLDLKEARIKNFVTPLSGEAALKAYGLNTSQHEIVLKTLKGESLSFKTGNKTDDGKNYFAKRPTDNLALVLGEETIDKIFRPLNDLKNRKLFAFKAEQAAKILIQYKDKAFELQKTGDDWNLVKPEKIKKLKPFVGRDIAWTLNNLEYDSVANPAPEVGSTGLDKPDLTITAWNEKGEELAGVLVGKPVTDKKLHYANIKNHPAVYRIPERFLSEIPKDLEKFKS